MKSYRGIFKRGSVYWIRYADPTGKIVRESARTTNINEAMKLLSKRKAEVADGKYPERVIIKNHTFKELAEKYKEWASIQRCWSRGKQYVIPILEGRFKDIILRKINPFIVEKFVVDLIKENKKPATVNKYITVLKHMIKKAIEWNMVEETILKKLSSIKPLKENNRRLRYLTKEEISKLLSACDKHLYPIVFTALNTGMRKEEILSLRWSNIDIKNGYIYVEKSKNGESRTIPMNEILLSMFRKMFTERKLNTDFVFVNPLTGSKYQDVKKAFTSALRKAQIEDFHFHDLRHTFASHLVMSGVDLTTVKELLGHKDIKMTLRYSHLAPEHKSKAVNALKSIFGTTDTKTDTVTDTVNFYAS